MSSEPKLADAVRTAILEKPDTILEDDDLMQALIGAKERVMGTNIVDLRAIAMDRMERRLDRLEDTHRSVIAAAYENLAGTNQVHRAILRMLDPVDFASFLQDLQTEVADILRVDIVRLVLETAQTDSDPALGKLGPVLRSAAPGYVDYYLSGGRSVARSVVLRQLDWIEPEIYGQDNDWVRSEACLRLDLGDGRSPGLLILGSDDAQQFTPQHGTDLLAFFGGVFERAMQHWLR